MPDLATLEQADLARQLHWLLKHELSDRTLTRTLTLTLT